MDSGSIPDISTIKKPSDYTDLRYYLTFGYGSSSIVFMYKKVKILTPVDAAYLAGLIDGEGSIMLTKTRKTDKYPSPKVTIASTSYSLLKVFKDLVGTGCIIQKKKYKTSKAGL